MNDVDLDMLHNYFKGRYEAMIRWLLNKIIKDKYVKSVKVIIRYKQSDTNCSEFVMVNTDD